MASPVIYSTWMYSMPLAQASAFEGQAGAAAAAAPVAKPMSFSDLQKGMRAYNSGEAKDNGFRNGTLTLLFFVALLALILHLRQRRKTAGPPDSMGKLGWELSRQVRFPFGSRFVLLWVGRSTGTPFASLLVSASLFDRAVNDWTRNPTFSAARHWGRTRLDRLRSQLFN
jgi:hypothetical protein